MKKKILISIILVIVVGLGVLAGVYRDKVGELVAMLKGTTTIYVDCVAGNDANDGLARDTAVATLTKAQELVRQYKESEGKNIRVELAAGTYYLDETLSFAAEDGGSDGLRVTWAGADEAQVSISGGTVIKDWTQYDAEKNIWVASTEGVYGRDFFVNDERATRARLEDNLEVTELTDTGFVTTSTSLQGLTHPEDVEIMIENTWTFSRAKMVNANGTTVTMDPLTWSTWLETAHLGGFDEQPSMIKYAENAVEFLDQPGEWFLDKYNNQIYYMPKDGEDMTKVETVLGRLETLVSLDGEVDAPVCDITFENLIFEHTSWNQPDEEGGYLTIQAGAYKRAGVIDLKDDPMDAWDYANWLYPSAAVGGEFTNGVEFTNNTIRHTSNDGIRLGSATKNASIVGNTLYDCGANGIVLGGFYDEDHHPIMGGASEAEVEEGMRYVSENNVITDNEVHDIASVSRGCVGIIVGYAARTDVSYNHLYSLPYTAISFGWGWGYEGDDQRDIYYQDEDGKNLFCDNTITHNRIENIMNYLKDGGGIYTLGRMEGMTISDNYIDEVHNEYGGIYLDNGTCGVTATNNVVSNCHRNYIYKGDYNVIKDNYAKAETAKQPDYEELEPVGKVAKNRYTFENNYLWEESEVEKIYEASGIRE